MTHEYPVDGPVEVRIDISAGEVELCAQSDASASVTTTADEQDEGLLDVRYAEGVLQVRSREGGPRVRWPGSHSMVRILVPAGSSLDGRTASADARVSGSWKAVRLHSRSGELSVVAECTSLSLEASSGDLSVDHAPAGTSLRSGSGDIRVDRCHGQIALTAGSGDVVIESMIHGGTIKTGSGDVRLGEAAADIGLWTGSGDVHIDYLGSGRLIGQSSSGSIVVTLPPGVPVWTDLRAHTGDVRCELPPVGPPQDGQDHVEVSYATSSGDITLIPR